MEVLAVELEALVRIGGRGELGRLLVHGLSWVEPYRAEEAGEQPAVPGQPRARQAPAEVAVGLVGVPAVVAVGYSAEDTDLREFRG